MTTGLEEYLEELKASRKLLHRFHEQHAELVARLPEGVRSEEDAATWAQFYLTATVGPEQGGRWNETVMTDGGNSRSLQKHVEFFVWRGLGPNPRYDDELPKPNREEAMWLLWRIADPPDLGSRAATWQAAAWAEEVLPSARYDAALLGFFSADVDVSHHEELVRQERRR